MYYFDIHVWIYDYSLPRNAIMGLLEFARHLVYESVKYNGKIRLIVMDELWDIKEWNEVKKNCFRWQCRKSVHFDYSLLDVAIYVDALLSLFTVWVLQISNKLSWSYMLQGKLFTKECCSRESAACRFKIHNS